MGWVISTAVQPRIPKLYASTVPQAPRLAVPPPCNYPRPPRAIMHRVCNVNIKEAHNKS